MGWVGLGWAEVGDVEREFKSRFNMRIHAKVITSPAW